MEATALLKDLAAALIVLELKDSNPQPITMTLINSSILI